MRFFAVLAAVVLAGQTSRAMKLNDGFETGDFTGWTTFIPSGNSEFSGVQPAGSAGVFSSKSFAGLASTITPREGSYFAALGSADYAYFRGAQNYKITASQTISLNRADSITGWSLFYNGDHAAQDSAWVRILDGGGNVVATPWLQVSGGSSYHTATPWTAWYWSASSADNYTIQLGVTTMGDDTLASYGLFDGIEITSAMTSVMVVPEPSEKILFALGLACLAAFNRRAAKSA